MSYPYAFREIIRPRLSLGYHQVQRDWVGDVLCRLDSRVDIAVKAFADVPALSAGMTVMGGTRAAIIEWQAESGRLESHGQQIAKLAEQGIAVISVACGPTTQREQATPEGLASSLVAAGACCVVTSPAQCARVADVINRVFLQGPQCEVDIRQAIRQRLPWSGAVKLPRGLSEKS